MSASTIVLAKIATLRFSPENSTSSAFTVQISGETSSISSSFAGAGEVEMNEVTFQCGRNDDLTVIIAEGELETHRVVIPMEKIRGESDWSILQVEDFEVRIQFLLSEPLPADFIDNTFELISGPKAWYFKAEDLYALIKTIAQQLKLPSQLGVTSEQIVERVSKLVDLATEAVMKNFTSLDASEELHVLQKVDELLTSQCTVFDSMVDSSRVKLVESLRKLKASLEASLREQREYVEAAVVKHVDSAKDLSAKAIDNVNSSVESITTSTKASIDDAKGKVEAYKTQVEGQVQTYKTQVQERVQSVKGEVTTRVTVLSEESKAWATEFLNARVVQTKEALDTAQPYVLQAVGATQPYASKVVTAAQPYVQMAMPYVEEAKKMAESNQYVGPYVEPVLNTANAVIASAKTYMGLDTPEKANTETTAEAPSEN